MQPNDLIKKMSLLDYRLNTSVNLNGLLCPPGSISERLSSYCNPLWLHDGDGDPSRNGSAVFVRFEGHYIALFTRHQLDGDDGSRISFLDNSGEIFIFGGSLFFNTEDHEHAHDLVILVLDKAVALGSFAEGRFFQLSGQSTPDVGEKVLMGAVYGFPYRDQKIEVDETGEMDFRVTAIGNVVRETIVEYSGDGNDDTICLWNSAAETAFDPDGISGGPTFAIVGEPGDLRAVFAGVNLMSNGQIFRVLKVDTIKRYILAALGEARKV